MFRNTPKIIFEANRPKLPGSMYNNKRYKMAILDSQNWRFCWKKNNKKRKVCFGIFQKTEYMWWRPGFAMPMPNFEAICLFLVTRLPKTKREKYIWQILLQFLKVVDHLQKIPPLNSPSKTESNRYQFCSKRPTSKFDLAWPDLTWPKPELHPNVIQII